MPCELYLQKCYKKKAGSHQSLNDFLVSTNYSRALPLNSGCVIQGTYLPHFHIFHYKKSSLLSHKFVSTIWIYNTLTEFLPEDVCNFTVYTVLVCVMKLCHYVERSLIKIKGVKGAVPKSFPKVKGAETIPLLSVSSECLAENIGLSGGTTWFQWRFSYFYII